MLLRYASQLYTFSTIQYLRHKRIYECSIQTLQNVHTRDEMFDICNRTRVTSVSSTNDLTNPTRRDATFFYFDKNLRTTMLAHACASFIIH